MPSMSAYHSRSVGSIDLAVVTHKDIVYVFLSSVNPTSTLYFTCLCMAFLLSLGWSQFHVHQRIRAIMTYRISRCHFPYACEYIVFRVFYGKIVIIRCKRCKALWFTIYVRSNRSVCSSCLEVDHSGTEKVLLLVYIANYNVSQLFCWSFERDKKKRCVVVVENFLRVGC